MESNLNWQEVADSLDSSYKNNNLGVVFYDLARKHQPALAVEVGVYQGYSAIHTMGAMKENGKGMWFGYDLFDDYSYRHCSIETAWHNIQKAGFADIANLMRTGIVGASENILSMFGNGSIDMLHIDVSNDGGIVEFTALLFLPLLRRGGLLLYEGGSKDRDNINWMQQYRKPSIFNAISLILSEGKYELLEFFDKFPSITVLRKI